MIYSHLERKLERKPSKILKNQNTSQFLKCKEGTRKNVHFEDRELMKVESIHSINLQDDDENEKNNRTIKTNQN